MNSLFNLKIFDNLNIYAQKGIKFVLYILAAVILYKILRFILQKIIQNKLNHRYLQNKKFKMIFSLGLNIIKYLIYFIAILLILKDVFNVNPALIITATGVLGLAFGLGIQGVLKDFISGVSILLENLFNVGDYIEFSNIKGRVTDISIKNVIIEDNNGNISIISNGIINKIIKHPGKYEKARFHIFYPKEVKKTDKIYSQIKKSFLKKHKEKIKSFDKIINNDNIGALRYMDFSIEIKPFNDTLIESIKQLLQKNIINSYIYIDRRPS